MVAGARQFDVAAVESLIVKIGIVIAQTGLHTGYFAESCVCFAGYSAVIGQGGVGVGIHGDHAV